MGADAFLTGEVKHHIALDASYHGVVLLEAGHFATENPRYFCAHEGFTKTRRI